MVPDGNFSSLYLINDPILGPISKFLTLLYKILLVFDWFWLDDYNFLLLFLFACLYFRLCDHHVMYNNYIMQVITPIQSINRNLTFS